MRVFLKTRTRDSGTTYYICSRRNGRKTLINRPARGRFAYGVGRYRIAGELVAYERVRTEGLEPSGGVTRMVTLRDALTGRQLRSLEDGAFRGAAFAEPEPGDGVRDLVVTSKGDLAWIVQNPTAIKPPEPNVNTSSRTTEVYAAPRGSDPILLDQGAAVRQTSLTRDGCTITWAHGTTRRTGRVCP